MIPLIPLFLLGGVGLIAWARKVKKPSAKLPPQPKTPLPAGPYTIVKVPDGIGYYIVLDDLAAAYDFVVKQAELAGAKGTTNFADVLAAMVVRIPQQPIRGIDFGADIGLDQIEDVIAKIRGEGWTFTRAQQIAKQALLDRGLV